MSTPAWLAAIRARCAAAPTPPCADFAQSVARMFSRMDEEDRSAFNECVFIARALRPGELPAMLDLAAALAGALDDIACWNEGPTVTGSFDEPEAARIARDALARWAAGPGATTGKERTT